MAQATKADPGQLWITGVDTFGLPITLGASMGKIAVSILNDAGETWVINGYGAGVGEGVDFKLDHLNVVIQKLIELGLKIGDIPNIHSKLKKFAFDSATAGYVLKRISPTNGFKMSDLTSSKAMVVTSASASPGAGVEVGYMTFFPASVDPLGTAVMLTRIAAGQPWGLYGSAAVGKLGLEIGAMSYVITSVERDGG